MPKYIYSDQQRSAVYALAALTPPMSSEEIARITGMNHNSVRHYLAGRSKTKQPETWATDIAEAIRAKLSGNNTLAAYYFVSAAKTLMKNQ